MVLNGAATCVFKGTRAVTNRRVWTHTILAISFGLPDIATDRRNQMVVFMMMVTLVIVAIATIAE